MEQVEKVETTETSTISERMCMDTTVCNLAAWLSNNHTHLSSLNHLNLTQFFLKYNQATNNNTMQHQGLVISLLVLLHFVNAFDLNYRYSVDNGVWQGKERLDLECARNWAENPTAEI